MSHGLWRQMSRAAALMLAIAVPVAAFSIQYPTHFGTLGLSTESYCGLPGATSVRFLCAYRAYMSGQDCVCRCRPRGHTTQARSMSASFGCHLTAGFAGWTHIVHRSSSFARTRSSSRTVLASADNFCPALKQLMEARLRFKKNDRIIANTHDGASPGTIVELLYRYITLSFFPGIRVTGLSMVYRLFRPACSLLQHQCQCV